MTAGAILVLRSASHAGHATPARRRETHDMSRILTLGALLLAATAAACGGAGDGDNPVSDSGGSTNVAASFVPDAASPGAGSVALAQGAVTGNVVTVRADVRGVNDVYGGGFELAFDSRVVEFVSWAPGTLLETGGHVPIYTVSPFAGKVVVGATRTGAVGGVDVTSAKALVRLTFRVTAAGSSVASLANVALLDSGPPAPAPIAGLAWFAGRFQAN